MEMQTKTMENGHSLSMMHRKLLGLEGVTNLESYDQEKIVLQTQAGMLEVKGEQLHIQQLNLEQGKVTVEGTVNALIYGESGISAKSKGLFSKLIR